MADIIQMYETNVRIDDETARAIAAEAALAAGVEGKASTGSVTALDNRVDAVEAALPGKASAAQGTKADSAVQPSDPIDTLAETVTAKIMTGTERTKLAALPIAADLTASLAGLDVDVSQLESGLAAEIAARESLGTNVNARIDAEIGAREALAQDTATIHQAIDGRLDGAESDIDQQEAGLSAEIGARESGDAAIVGGAPEALNTLAKIAAALLNNPDFAENVVGRLDQEVVDRQTGDAETRSTIYGPGALPALLTFAQVAAALGGDANFSANVIASFEAEAAARAAISGPVPENLNTLAKLAEAVNGDTAFGANVIASLLAEADAREAISGPVPANLNSLAKIAAAIAGDPNFHVRVATLESLVAPNDPATFDAGGTTVTVPAGSIPMNGNRTLAWSASNVTSPLPASEAVGGVAIAAGVNVVTALTHETILSVENVTRDSDGATMTAGTHYTVDMSRGLVTNLTASAMTMSYVGGLQRKDIVSIDPQAVNPVPVITTGTARPRASEMWAADLPAGQMEIGRISRRRTQAFYIPRHKWRNGVHLDRLPEDAAQLDYNRNILPPVIARLARGLPVRFIAYGNSRTSMGMFGDPVKLNTNPNSQYSADPTDNWSRDAIGYYERWDDATRLRAGVLPAEAFDTTVGYNLPAGTPDGFGAVHTRQGYVWAFLKALHAKYPDAVIDYRNWGIAGSSTGTGAVNGLGNALYPQRWDAVRADIIPGQTLFIPPDPMNEIGSTESYANWMTIAQGAHEAGAVVHFMGLSRPDPRFDPNGAAKASFSAQEMARAAWDSGSAISDGWRLTSPRNLQGQGLCEDEIASLNMTNHEGTILADAIGRDAARNY